MNKQLILAKRPIGIPDKDTWNLVETEIPQPGEGQFLVEQYYISLDPAMRGWMNDARSYVPPIAIGEVMRAGAAGKVLSSHHPGFQPGDYVYGWGGVQQYAVTNGRGWYKVDPSVAPLPVYTSTLGMPGLTAYFGLLNVGALKNGETVVISGAAGAVGSVAGQIAKIRDCRVVGIAGGAEKCAYLVDELGFDAAIDYKNENVWKSLKQHCPEGIDVYFDNVGGDILNAALAQIRMRGRIVICGAISQYNTTSSVQGPSNYLSLLVNRARMEGFLIMDYAREYPHAITEMASWMAEGKLKSKEYICEGIENFHETFLRLFSGKKLGKLVLEIGKEE